MKKIKKIDFYQIKSPDLFYLKSALISFIFLTVSQLHAAQWEKEYGVGASINYVDNIRLADSGLEESDLVYEVTPFISAEAVSGRANMELFYQLQAIGYKENYSANAVYHQLYADMNLELSEEFLFLDMRATNSQSVVSSTDRMPIGNLPISGNRTNVATYTISPYISKNFSGNTSILLRGTFNKTSYDDEVVTDVDSEIDNRSYNFVLSNDSAAGRIGFNVSLNRNEFSSENISETYYEDHSLTLPYRLSRQLTPFVTVGTEKSNVDQSIPKSGVEYWRLGFGWDPTARTSISVSKGKRFYGDASSFSWDTRGRWLQIGVDYNETLTTTSRLFSRESLSRIQNPDNIGDVGDITDAVFLSKRFTSRITYQKSKTIINLQVYTDDRSYISTNENGKYLGGNISWGWSIGARTGLDFGAQWRRDESRSEYITTLKSYSVVVSYVVSRRIDASMGYRYSNNEVEATGAGYTQNIIYLNATATY